VQIQLSALEIETRPEVARYHMQHLLDEDVFLDVVTKTLAKYTHAKACFAMDDLDAATRAFEETLDWAGANGTEQHLASELAISDDVREFVKGGLAKHPVLSVILRRIETMRTVAQQYQLVSEDVPTLDKLSFYALGKAEVQGLKQPSLDLKPLPREVLFFLADRGRVERDILLESFWPHYPPGRQIANLHTAVYSLRRLLGRETILHEGSVYSLNPELSIEYDVDQFERMASIVDGLPPGDPRRLFALTEAISSYGGPFLPEISSEWVFERRRELELYYLDLLTMHANEALVRDQPTRALRTLRQALDIDPYRDDTNLHFLEALGRLGRRSEAIDHYQRYVRLLADELSLDPPEEIRDLYTRLIG
jgi:DNA-binding SARP family transcriptional activator